MKMDECYDLRCVAFLPTFLAQTFVASLVSSVFFASPKIRAIHLLEAKKRGFGSMILPSGRCKDQKGWTKIPWKKGNIIFGWILFGENLTPLPMGYELIAQRFVEWQFLCRKKSWSWILLGKAMRPFGGSGRTCPQDPDNLFFLNWLLRVDVEHFQTCYFYNW